MSNNYWLNTTTVTRSTSVAPVFGGGLGSVCPQHVDVPMRKRIADGATAAHKGLGSVPWSHPTG